MDREASQATVHGIAKNWTGLSDCHFISRWVLYQVERQGDKTGLPPEPQASSSQTEATGE